jgi:hypothetical protein
MSNEDRLSALHAARGVLEEYNYLSTHGIATKKSVENLVSKIRKLSPLQLDPARVRRKGGHWFVVYLFEKLEESYWVLVPGTTWTLQRLRKSSEIKQVADGNPKGFLDAVMLQCKLAIAIGDLKVGK